MFPLLFCSNTGLLHKIVDAYQFPTFFTPLSCFQTFHPISHHGIMISSEPTFQQNYLKQIETIRKIASQTDATDRINVQKRVGNEDHTNLNKCNKRIQNPNRNVYTNLTNLILNSMMSKKKMSFTLQNIDPNLVGEKLVVFYKYVKSLRSHFSSYFNMEKVKKLFQGISIPHFNKYFHQILRKAAKIILEEKIPICTLTSKKLSPLLRKQHLHARRVMLLILKNDNQHIRQY